MIPPLWVEPQLLPKGEPDMLHAIKNQSSDIVKPCELWNTQTIAHPDEQQTSLDSRCGFYSGLEGLIPSVRISDGNPAVRMNWIVADYDGQIDQPMRDTVLERCADCHPQYICKTISGGAQLLWRLESPFLLHSNDLTIRLMQHVRKKLGLSKIMVGLDAATFDDPCHYYEAGTEWKQLSSDVIPSAFMNQWAIEVGNRYSWRKEGTAVPLEVVAEEVERKFPCRWIGDFVNGARGVRFWDPLAGNETAAVVRDSGMQCFAGSLAFISWSTILGPSFVRKYEADRISAAVKGIWFDGRDYWHQCSDSQWMASNKWDTIMHLKVDGGLSASTPRNSTCSEVEKAMTHINHNQYVNCAAPLIHRKKGLVHVNGLRILNISNTVVLQPTASDSVAEGRSALSASMGDLGLSVAADVGRSLPSLSAVASAKADVSNTPILHHSDTSPGFPWLESYFTGLFDPPEQLDYFFAWLQRWYKSALDDHMLPGQAAFFAGVPNTGKTLLSTLILSRIFGGHTDASSYLCGDDNFNSHLFESAVWAVDDVVPLTNRRSHIKFSALIKKLAANRTFSVREKYKIDKTIEWNGRVVVTCNTDPESIRILPDMDLSNRDKINLFRVGKRKGFAFPADVAKIVHAELPFFLRWLLDWIPPAHVVGDTRYGVKTYCEVSLLDSARHSSSAYSFLEVLLKFFEGRVSDVWTGSATELHSAMLTDQDGLSAIAAKYTTSQVGRELSKLASQGYPLTQSRQNVKRIWTVNIHQLSTGTK